MSHLSDWADEMNATSKALNPKPPQPEHSGGTTVVIKHTGMYSDFSNPPKVGARRYQEGDVVTFPGDYARGIIASGLAELFVETPLEPAAEPEQPKPKRSRKKKG